jgi:hypothetical protein
MFRYPISHLVGQSDTQIATSWTALFSYTFIFILFLLHRSFAFSILFSSSIAIFISSRPII